MFCEGSGLAAETVQGLEFRVLGFRILAVGFRI